MQQKLVRASCFLPANHPYSSSVDLLQGYNPGHRPLARPCVVMMPPCFRSGRWGTANDEACLLVKLTSRNPRVLLWPLYHLLRPRSAVRNQWAGAQLSVASSPNSIRIPLRRQTRSTFAYRRRQLDCPPGGACGVRNRPPARNPTSDRPRRPLPLS